MSTPGTLYIVSTPIGNLGDISARAIETLKVVDTIAAEDTRHSRRLLDHLGIRTPLLAYHEHNEEQSASKLLKLLQEGKSLALISDAGTPLINDPGYHLIQLVRGHGIRVVPIPGACALIAALSAAGLPTDRFAFEGFLAAKHGARVAQLKASSDETRTLIFYETPHRILAALEDMVLVFGEDRVVAIARELTKTFETIISGTLKKLIAQLTADPDQQKGEFVILVKGADKVTSDAEETRALSILKVLLAELPVSQAVRLTAEITNVKKNWLYERAIVMPAKAGI